MIFVNFKTYEKASGEAAVLLARKASDCAKETAVEIIICPQAVDLKEVVSNYPAHPPNWGVWAQHVDASKRGRSTGWLPPEVAKEKGAEGSLLNHSEHKLTLGVLSETLSRCKKVELKTLVFADTLEEARMVAMLKPDFVGYEPPSLIASKETSVAKAKPEVIRKVIEKIEIPIVVGAGVKDKKDVEVSLRLGAKGVGVSSAVILADNPKKVLMDLCEGFKRFLK